MVALAACLAVPTGLVHDDYLRTVLWGGAILASAVGWGAVIARGLYGDDAAVGWGLEAALGMAFHLVLGGVLAVLSLVSVTTCYIAVILGVVLFSLTAWRSAAAEAAPPDSGLRNGTRTHPGIVGVTVVILFFGVALFNYFGWAAERPANIIDDFHAYFSFPKQLLATGTLIEPFSSRRIDSYGGQSYLQALVLAFSTISRIGVLDYGICVLVLAGLVIGWVRDRPRLSFAVAVPALLSLFMRHDFTGLNYNAASEFSGAVFFVAIFRVLDRPRRAGESAWANALALALVASGACTLRPTNFAAAVLIPAAYYGLRMAREGDARRRWAQEAALAAFFSLTLLVPWMVLAYRSGGTPLYPLILGNGAKEYISSEPISTVEKARYFVMASLYPGRLPGLLLALAAGLFVPSRVSLSLRASLAGTAVATIMLFNALAPADSVDSTDRFLFPFGFAYLLAVSLVAAAALANRAMTPVRSAIAMVLVVGALVLQLFQGGTPSRCPTSPICTLSTRRWRIPLYLTSIPVTVSMRPSNAPSRIARRSSSCSISLFVSTSGVTASLRGISRAPSAPRLTCPSARARAPWLGICSARASVTSPTVMAPRRSFRMIPLRWAASARASATLPTATAAPQRNIRTRWSTSSGTPHRSATERAPAPGTAPWLGCTLTSLAISGSSPQRGSGSMATRASTSSTLPRPRRPLGSTRCSRP